MLAVAALIADESLCATNLVDCPCLFWAETGLSHDWLAGKSFTLDMHKKMHREEWKQWSSEPVSVSQDREDDDNDQILLLLKL